MRSVSKGMARGGTHVEKDLMKQRHVCLCVRSLCVSLCEVAQHRSLFLHESLF